MPLSYISPNIIESGGFFTSFYWITKRSFMSFCTFTALYPKLEIFDKKWLDGVYVKWISELTETCRNPMT